MPLRVRLSHPIGRPRCGGRGGFHVPGLENQLESKPKLPQTSHKKMSHTTREIFQTRREAKWQFRRGLVLEVAKILEQEPNRVWPQISETLAKLSTSPSPSIKKNTRRWIRFAGKTPGTTIQTIRTYFSWDTPEGPRRHKLQDLSDGHPFSGILPDSILKRLRESVAAGKSIQREGELGQFGQ